MTATNTASFDANYGSGTNADGSPMGLNMAFGTDLNGVGNGTFAGKLDFSGSGFLTINNNAYTLITSWDQLTAISGVAGYFALASNLTAPSTALSGAAIAEAGPDVENSFPQCRNPRHARRARPYHLGADHQRYRRQWRKRLDQYG